MSVVVVATFKAKEEHFPELCDFMAEILPETAKRAGAEVISAASDAHDKSVVVWEIWDTIESQKAYLGWRGERGDVDKIVAMLREPPSFAEMTHLPI